MADWGTGETISDFIGSLGSDIFSMLHMKGYVLHCAYVHLKVLGWSLVLNALLIKNYLMFLSCLNEINEGWEKTIPVLGSLWSIYSVLACWILLHGPDGEMWGWMEFYHYSPSETFVVLTSDQFAGMMMALLITETG